MYCQEVTTAIGVLLSLVQTALVVAFVYLVSTPLAWWLIPSMILATLAALTSCVMFMPTLTAAWYKRVVLPLYLRDQKQVFSLDEPDTRPRISR